MKVGILLFIIGSVLTLYLSKVKLKRQLLSNIGIVIGILLLVYGLILSVQPDNYIQFTKTTISKDINTTKK
jgi:sulfite exporter TauE/SafE